MIRVIYIYISRKLWLLVSRQPIEISIRIKNWPRSHNFLCVSSKFSRQNFSSLTMIVPRQVFESLLRMRSQRSIVAKYTFENGGKEWRRREKTGGKKRKGKRKKEEEHLIRPFAGRYTSKVILAQSFRRRNKIFLNPLSLSGWLLRPFFSTIWD